MATPEGRVKLACKEVLRRFGVWYYMPVSNGMGQVGIPDFVCCWQGRLLMVEAKAPGKRNNTTPNQQRVMEEVQRHKGLALVVDDPQQLINFLEQEIP